MIGAAYARTMADYNSAMNAALYAAAARLPDAERSRNRGAFWTSIHGTLSHLLWADRMWMSRFDDWEAPEQSLPQSGEAYATFLAMAQARAEADTRISAWAKGLTDAWFDRDQTWFSGAVGRQMTAPRQLFVVHFFNHQTHHRGQIHAMLTAAGETTGPTDLPLVLTLRSA